MFNNKKSLLVFLSVLAWLILFGVGLSKHEFWRDEMRALSIAISAPTFADLPFYLKNEGHPILWYAFLKLAYNCFHATWVLPLCSFIFSFGIVVLVMFRSPFTLLIKLLLIFGVYCLYEYGINARNYGIGAFFMLLFADSFSRYPKNIFLAFLCLSMAALTNVYATMMVGLIGVYTMLEYKNTNGITTPLKLSILILIAAIGFSLYTMLPDTNSLVASKKIIDFVSIKELWVVGYGFDDYLNYKMHFSAYFLSVVLAGGLLLFLPNWRTMLFLILALFAMVFFSLCIKGNLMHHQGMYFYTMVVFAWLQYDTIQATLTRKNMFSLLVLIGVVVNVFVLGVQVLKGYEKYRDDIVSSCSESKRFGNWCQQNITDSAVIIAEPDFTMEGVMYYHNTPFYIQRENRWGTYVHFTAANQAYLNLETLIFKANQLSQSKEKVFVVFDKKIPVLDTVYSYSYGKKFEVSKFASKAFYEQYQLIDSFNQNFHSEENYYIYQKK